MKTWTARMISGALVLIGAAPMAYLLVLLVAQLFTSIKAGGWVGLPLTLLFTEPAALQASKAAPIVGLIPNLSSLWTAGPDSPAALMWLLGKVHVAAIPALLGLPLIVAGVLKIHTRREEVRSQKERHEDRLRRVSDYQREDAVIAPLDGRREPYIANWR